MVSFVLCVVVVAATIICKISCQENYQEHLTPEGKGANRCQSQQAAGRNHSDVLRCSFRDEVSNFHVQFYPQGSFSKEIPDMQIVLSCSSSCEIPQAFEDYIFINQSAFHSSEDHTYTFEVLPNKTTNGSFMCQGFHKVDPLYTDFCNVSDHILLRNLTDVLPQEPSPPAHQKEPTEESNSTTASPSLLLLLLLLLVPVIVVVSVAVWKISCRPSDRNSNVEENNNGNMSSDSQSTHEITQTNIQTESEELLSKRDKMNDIHREQKW